MCCVIEVLPCRQSTNRDCPIQRPRSFVGIRARGAFRQSETHQFAANRRKLKILNCFHVVLVHKRKPYFEIEKENSNRKD